MKYHSWQRTFHGLTSKLVFPVQKSRNRAHSSLKPKGREIGPPSVQKIYYIGIYSDSAKATGPKPRGFIMVICTGRSKSYWRCVCLDDGGSDHIRNVGQYLRSHLTFLTRCFIWLMNYFFGISLLGVDLSRYINFFLFGLNY